MRYASLVWLVIVLTAHSESGQTRGDSTINQRSFSADTRITTSGADSQVALSRLLAIAVNNRLPFGIVIADDTLCTRRLRDTRPEITISDVISDIDTQIPGYSAELRDGVIDIYPHEMTSSTKHFLDIEIPRLSSQTDIHRGLGVNLWMFIRAVLLPQEGTAFVGGSDTGEETVPGFSISHATVRSLLNHISTTGHGAVWLLYSLPSDFRSYISKPPYKIYGYAGDDKYIDQIGCAN